MTAIQELKLKPVKLHQYFGVFVEVQFAAFCQLTAPNVGEGPLAVDCSVSCQLSEQFLQS